MRLIHIIAACVLACSSVHAADPDKKLEIAREIALLTNQPAIDSDKFALDAKEQLRDAFMWKNLNEKERKDLDDAIETVVGTLPGEILTAIAISYKTTFTMGELVEIRRFLESNAGRAFMQKQDRLNGKLNLILQQFATQAHRRVEALRRRTNEGKNEREQGVGSDAG